MRDTVHKARRAWRILGANRCVEEDYFDDGHRINGIKAYPFLAHHLRVKEPAHAVARDSLDLA